MFSACFDLQRTLGAIFLLLGLMAASASLSATIEVEKSKTCPSEIYLRGEIVEGDHQRLQAALTSIEQCNHRRKWSEENVTKYLVLSSPGGLVSEAMKIGRLIRGKMLRTEVGRGQICYSSCVLIYAAGVYRSLAVPYPPALKERGRYLGIHRPFFREIPSGSDYAAVRRERDRLVAQMKDYAREIDFSEKLIDDMLAIPRDEIKILAPEEQEAYRIAGADATWEELTDAKDAKFWGLSLDEYRKRSDRAREVCDLSVSDGCYTAIYLGVSKNEAMRRHNRSNVICTPLEAQGELIFYKCVDDVIVQGK